MLRIAFLSLLLILGTAVSAQESETEPLDFDVTTGSLEQFHSYEDGNGLLFVIGEKVERSFRADFFLTEGKLDIEEGNWLIDVMAVGGRDRTNWGDPSFEYEARPSRCVGSPREGMWSENVLFASCAVNLSWVVKSSFPLSILAIVKLPESTNIEASRRSSPTVRRPTARLTAQPTVRPTSRPTVRPTVDTCALGLATSWRDTADFLNEMEGWATQSCAYANQAVWPRILQEIRKAQSGDRNALYWIHGTGITRDYLRAACGNAVGMNISEEILFRGGQCP